MNNRHDRVMETLKKHRPLHLQAGPLLVALMDMSAVENTNKFYRAISP